MFAQGNFWYDLFCTYFHGAEHAHEVMANDPTVHKEAIELVAEKEFDNYKDDIEKLTLLVMVINHISWYHHDDGNDELSQLYADLYYKYYEKAIDYLDSNGRDEDLTYFIRTLD